MFVCRFRIAPVKAGRERRNKEKEIIARGVRVSKWVLQRWWEKKCDQGERIVKTKACNSNVKNDFLIARGYERRRKKSEMVSTGVVEGTGCSDASGLILLSLSLSHTLSLWHAFFVSPSRIFKLSPFHILLILIWPHSKWCSQSQSTFH